MVTACPGVSPVSRGSVERSAGNAGQHPVSPSGQHQLTHNGCPRGITVQHFVDPKRHTVNPQWTPSRDNIGQHPTEHSMNIAGRCLNDWSHWQMANRPSVNTIGQKLIHHPTGNTGQHPMTPMGHGSSTSSRPLPKATVGPFSIGGSVTQRPLDGHHWPMQGTPRAEESRCLHGAGSPPGVVGQVIALHSVCAVELPRAAPQGVDEIPKCHSSKVAPPTGHAGQALPGIVHRLIPGFER